VDDLEAVLDNPDGHEFFTVVAAVHHQGVDQSLNDGALGLAETFGSITTCGTNSLIAVGIQILNPRMLGNIQILLMYTV
jgi:hypothetical protein